MPQPLKDQLHEGDRVRLNFTARSRFPAFAHAVGTVTKDVAPRSVVVYVKFDGGRKKISLLFRNELELVASAESVVAPHAPDVNATVSPEVGR